MKTIREQAEEIKAKGSPLSIEKIIAIIEKKAVKKSKRSKSWKKRDSLNAANDKLNAKLANMSEAEKVEYFEEVKRRSLEGQLPSSMR